MTTDLLATKNDQLTNILFIYHRINSIGGIETRWIDEFQYLEKHNYKVHMLTNYRDFNPKTAELFPTCHFITVDIESPSLATEFIKLVDCVVENINSRNIQVISIHMLDLFACAAVMAAQICRIPIISTTHGTLDIYRKPFDRLFIQYLAGKSFSLSVRISKTIDNILPSQIGNTVTTLIPNLINTDKYQKQTSKKNQSWLLISRISPEKYPSILRFLQAANECQIHTVDIAGGGEQDKLRKLIKELNLKLQVNFLGEVRDMATLISQYSGIAGMGRVAIEGLASQKPVCIISPEGKLIGLVSTKNFQYLKDYNFTGKGLVSIDNKELSTQLQQHTSKQSQELYDLLENELSVENWSRHIELYKQVAFIDNKPLESLYHKLAYFSITLSRPFEQDKFFWHLFYETLIEYKLDHIKELYHYYDDSIGLIEEYPNPYKSHKKSRWQDKFK